MPLGIQDDDDYQTVPTAIKPGDVVVLCTDGVTEAMNPDLETFGISGLKRSLSEAPAGAAAVGAAILSDVRRHAAGQDPNDDITLLCFGRP